MGGGEGIGKKYGGKFVLIANYGEDRGCLSIIRDSVEFQRGNMRTGTFHGGRRLAY